MRMLLVRSWPLDPPEGHPRVFDDAERLYNTDYDYSGLAEYGDDILHLDWDVAVHREDALAFAAMAAQEPQRVLVAPVRVYPDSRRGLAGPLWAAKRYEGNGMRYVTDGEPTCHIFGFGMVYLPGALLRRFVDEFAADLATRRVKLDDVAFSGWHHHNVEPEARIDWDVRPVHTNYRISEVLA
jgi:hypothetical protein